MKKASLRGRKTARRRPKPWGLRLAVGALVLILGLLTWAVMARQLAPASNTSLERFDAIIVLGTPADANGNPTPAQLSSVTEAVHEYDRDVAPRLIMTGGAAYNQFVEARVMARTAEAQGIPESAIFVEPEALDTIQNACYSARIMKEHGWQSAEVVSLAPHLPRAGLILSELPLQWRTHAAAPLWPLSSAEKRTATIVETLKTARYLLWARLTERCEP